MTCLFWEDDMTYVASFVSWCCWFRMRLNPCIRCILQETQRQCSSIKIAPNLNEHPIAEIVESQPHADAAEVKPQRFSCVRTHPVSRSTAVLSRPSESLQMKCPFFGGGVCRCMLIQDVILPHAHTVLPRVYKGKKVPSLSCTRAKLGILSSL